MDKIIDFSKRIISEIENKNIAVDMTCGRGNDTLFLAENFKQVYAFDIQECAINDTNKLLNDNSLNNYKLFNDSFINIDKYDINNIDCVMYNLGYLPKGDKSIHTISTDTLESLKKVLKLMNKDGIISICFYPGFPSGKEESILLDNYLRTIDQKEFDVLKYDFINQVNNPPYLVLIRKR